jgi:hypothetical protein
MSLADDIGNSFAATGQRLGVKAATLVKVTPGTRTPGSISGGTNPTTVSYSCSGFVSTFDAFQIDGALIRAEDRKVSLFASTLTAGIVPEPNDKITIDGLTYGVVSILERDPAAVMFTCHGRL